MITLTVQTHAQSELRDITQQVQEAVRQGGVDDGLCALFIPHTTAGVTLNENWDSDVQRDILLTLADIAPVDPRHRHREGNSPAHIKASMVGASALVIVKGGQLQLGRWQGVYLAEFDGPRSRNVWVKVVAG